MDNTRVFPAEAVPSPAAPPIPMTTSGSDISTSGLPRTGAGAGHGRSRKTGTTNNSDALYPLHLNRDRPPRQRRRSLRGARTHSIVVTHGRTDRSGDRPAAPRRAPASRGREALPLDRRWRLSGRGGHPEPLRRQPRRSISMLTTRAPTSSTARIMISRFHQWWRYGSGRRRGPADCIGTHAASFRHIHSPTELRATRFLDERVHGDPLG